MQQTRPVPADQRTGWTPEYERAFRRTYFTDWARGFKRSCPDWEWRTEGMCARLSTGVWGGAAVATPDMAEGQIAVLPVKARNGRHVADGIRIRIIVEDIAFGSTVKLTPSERAWLKS